jgi:protein SCO1/2
MRRRSLVLGGLAVAAAAAAGGGGLLYLRTKEGQSRVKIGGSFTLRDVDGAVVTDRDLLGKPTLIYFGFTYCPEICPTTLSDIGQWLERLGPRADQLNVIFISLDPERDTGPQMKRYLANFDPRIRGLTGSVEAVAATAKAYRIYYRKVALEAGEYTVDHSTAVYLFDKNGTFVAPIGYGSAPERAMESLNAVLD